MNKFIWYGKNKHFNEVQFSHAMTTDDLLRGSYPSWFSLDNRKPHNNCEFLAECFFTGFKDSIGKEIFEGDILIFDYKGQIYKGFVTRDEYQSFVLKTNEKEYNIYHIQQAKAGRILGNIYQNREILN
jgi:uncharacterized phage protein (TIGR01671 family)